MKFWKSFLLFSIGGGIYVGLELLWRGRSHISMYLAGGACFLLLGKISRIRPKFHWSIRGIFGALVITSVELLTGLISNRSYTVWDYREMPMNFLGQVCLPFSLLWIPLSLGAMALYNWMDKAMEEPPG